MRREKYRIKIYVKKSILLFTCLMVVCVFSSVGLAKGERLFWFMESPGAHTEMYTHGYKEFEKQYGVKIEASFLDFEALTEKLVTLTSARSPAWDLVNSHFSINARFEQYFLPLENYLSDEEIGKWFDWGIEAVTFDGHIKALSWNADLQLLLYRKDWFEKAGLWPPRTWEEFLYAAQKLTTPDHFGFSIAGTGDAALRRFSDYLWQAGGEFFDENLKPAWNSPAGVEALQFYVDLIHKFKIAPPGTPSYKWWEEYKLFRDGHASMFHAWNIYFGELEDSELSAAAGKIGYALIPGYRVFVNTATCPTITVNKYSNHKELAVKFLKYMTSDNLVKWRAENWNLAPMKRTVFKDVISEAKGHDKFVWQLLNQSMKYGKHWPLKLPEWNRISNVIWDQIGLALIKQKTPREALDQSAKEAKEILEMAGYYK